MLVCVYMYLCVHVCQTVCVVCLHVSMCVCVSVCVCVMCVCMWHAYMWCVCVCVSSKTCFMTPSKGGEGKEEKMQQNNW